MKPSDWMMVIIVTILLGITVVMVQRFSVVLNELEIIKIEIKQLYNEINS